MGKPVCRENEREIQESRARCDSIEELAGSKWPAEPAEASMNETGRLFARVVLSAIGALATHGASAQTADDAVVCNGPHSTVAADDRIAACTRVIDSGQWRSKSIRKLRKPLSNEASFGRQRAKTTRRSPTTTRQSGSIRRTRSHS